jgi:Malectin domain
MPQDPNSQSAEAERAELACVVEALAKWPRLSRLLEYMGEKVFSGDSDHLNEYDIATEVLGRSKTVFNAAEDAIARVETHRLRKRLGEFYATEGKDHPIQVTLPSGTYVPHFNRKPAEDSSPALSHAERPPEAQSQAEAAPSRASLVFRWHYLVLAAILAVILLAVFLYVRPRLSTSLAPSTEQPTSAVNSAASRPEAASSAIRLLAGYSGPPRSDSAGRIWSPDQYFAGGGPWQPPPGSIARTSDPFLFARSRTGDFSYNIPLKPGSYELHLFFSTQALSDASTSFNVAINKKGVLEGFDINSDALGDNIADEKIFRDVSSDQDGFLHLTFSGGTGSPALNAIEILPGIPHAQLPIRLVMQTTPFTDHEGRFWHPDNYFMNGRLRPAPHPILNSADPDLFSGERFGHFTYAIPVDTRGRYTLVLHFVELYFGPGLPGGGGVGRRVFNVMCNGQTLLADFDVFREGGSLHEVTKTFRHLKPSPQGKLDLTFEPSANNATVSGIEVLDESQ